MLLAQVEFIVERWPELWLRTGEHLFLTGVATGIAILLGIPMGIACLRVRNLRGPVLSSVGILQTIPSLAMLAFLLSLLGKIGALPAILALILYALLPITRNTLTGLQGVSERTLEAARGVGMTDRQCLWLIQFPLALPVIVAGIRTAAVIGVGIATLSAFIGAGGLGQFINRGLALSDTSLILLGSIPAAILALLVDFAIWSAEWGFRPTHTAAQRKLQSRLKPLALSAPALLIIFGFVTYLVPWHNAGEKTNHDIVQGSVGNSTNIRIGSKEFAEQLLLGELLAQLIEANTTHPVERKFGLGGTMICHEALVKGQIDLYPEYTGTGYLVVLKKQMRMGPYNTFHVVDTEYQRRFNLKWLEPFGFNNTYAITVRQADAEEKNWKAISDLKESASQLRAGFTSEFQERPDGYPGLRQTYGLQFATTFDVSPTLMCEALARNEVDVICAFATDGRIPAYDLFVLQDDRGFFPPYDAAPVIRSEIIQKYPEINEVLDPLAGILNDQIMQQLNYEVEGRKRAPKEVAHEFLLNQKLIATP